MKELEQRGYTHIQRFAAGNEGALFLCRKQDRQYLAKEYAKPDPGQADLFRQIASLKSEYFPRIVEIIQTGGSMLVVREFIEGNTLADEIRKNGAYAFSRASKIVRDVCCALQVLHDIKPHPIIYRDLKPENIIILPTGGVKLIDFGIARYYKGESVRDTVLAGTMGYTAPEVMAGMQSDERSDVYSAGLLLYELLSGKSLRDPPYQIRPLAENNAYLPEGMDEIIAKATDISQINRYATIGAFVCALETVEQAGAARRKKRKRNRLLLVLALAAVSAAAVWMGISFSGRQTTALLELRFEDEAEAAYINAAEDQIAVADGCLQIFHGGCSICYKPSGSTIVHIRLQTTDPGGSIGFGPFHINSSVAFECIYYNEALQSDLTTWNQQLDGFPIVNMRQWIDYIFAFDKQNHAIYAVACDNETLRIAYAAYRIPEALMDQVRDIALMAYFEPEQGYMKIDTICIAEGSLLRYLRETMPAYRKNRRKADAFLLRSETELPDMVFKPPQEW